MPANNKTYSLVNGQYVEDPNGKFLYQSGGGGMIPSGYLDMSVKTPLGLPTNPVTGQTYQGATTGSNVRATTPFTNAPVGGAAGSYLGGSPSPGANTQTPYMPTRIGLPDNLGGNLGGLLSALNNLFRSGIQNWPNTAGYGTGVRGYTSQVPDFSSLNPYLGQGGSLADRLSSIYSGQWNNPTSAMNMYADYMDFLMPRAAAGGSILGSVQFPGSAGFQMPTFGQGYSPFLNASSYSSNQYNPYRVQGK